MRRRPARASLDASLPRKLRTLKLLSPDDHKAIVLLLDDVLARRMDHIELTEYWRGPARRKA